LIHFHFFLFLFQFVVCYCSQICSSCCYYH
jgi:hypothetical protein